MGMNIMRMKGRAKMMRTIKVHIRLTAFFVKIPHS